MHQLEYQAIELQRKETLLLLKLLSEIDQHAIKLTLSCSYKVHRVSNLLSDAVYIWMRRESTEGNILITCLNITHVLSKEP